MKRKKVFLLSTFLTTFIKLDIKILQDFSEVKPVVTKGFKSVFVIFWNVLRCDVIFCWFGSVYSAVAVIYAKILRKPTIVVLAGVDAEALPEINYGIWLSPWKSKLLKYGLRNTNKVLVVAPSMKEKIMKFAKYDGNNIEYLPFGFDTSYWNIGEKKQKIVLSVGGCDSKTRFLKKGFDFLIEAAAQLPDTPFVIIGIDEPLVEKLGITVPGHVQLIPTIAQGELLAYYQRSAVYCQPSRSEGLPNTLCEAMACACIPVGTNVDGIPTAIGNTGFIVEFGDLENLVNALKKAISSDESHGLKSRQRIIKEFPIERRIEGLKKTIMNIDATLDSL
jgi:glycosyltransferase involved in cell wall biosynthesis